MHRPEDVLVQLAEGEQVSLLSAQLQPEDVVRVGVLLVVLVDDPLDDLVDLVVDEQRVVLGRAQGGTAAPEEALLLEEVLALRVLGGVSFRKEEPEKAEDLKQTVLSCH